MNPKNFFAELKRRNVYKVAVAYAVIAWLLIQAGSILFPTFEAPGWVMKVFVAVVAAGFPIALVIAWAFEMTPEGMKRTEDLSPNEFIPSWSRRKFAALIVTVAFAAAALLVFQFIRAKSSSSMIAKSPAVTAKSIAVLPFENLSRDPDNAYFADGIQDEILSTLGKINDLRVISRTSTAKYKSRPDNLRQVGTELGVATILEGSVQRATDRVRVIVQLIDAASDAHLWSETYDRELKDIFSVQSEIAQNIATSLKAKLSPGDKQSLGQLPTQSAEAHELYLKAGYFVRQVDAGNGDPAHAIPQAIARTRKPSPKIPASRWPTHACPMRIPGRIGSAWTIRLSACTWRKRRRGRRWSSIRNWLKLISLSASSPTGAGGITQPPWRNSNSLGSFCLTTRRSASPLPRSIGGVVNGNRPLKSSRGRPHSIQEIRTSPNPLPTRSLLPGVMARRSVISSALWRFSPITGEGFAGWRHSRR